MEQRSRRSDPPAVATAKAAGVASAVALSLLLSPFFIGSLLAVAALVSGSRRRDRRRTLEADSHGEEGGRTA